MKRVLFLFGQLNDQDIEWLTDVGMKRHVDPGEVLIEEGRTIDNMFIVLDGSLSVLQGGANAIELAQLGCGEIVGEMSFIDGRPPSATVKVLEEALVFGIPTSALAGKLRSDMGFSSRFHRALALFLSYRLRGTVGRLGHGKAEPIDDDQLDDMDDELDPNLLDTVHLAGQRFSKLLQDLRSH